MKKFNDIFRDYIGYILSVLVVLGYVLTALMTIATTDKTIGEIIVNGFIIFTLGVLLANTMGHQGINEGEKDEEVKKTKNEHHAMLLTTQPYWDEIEAFCNLKNRMALQQERERILNFATLKYSDYFDVDGNFIGAFHEIPEDKRLKSLAQRKNAAIEKSISLQVTQITPTDLITENAKPNDPLARGRSKRQYLIQTNAQELFAKVATAVVGGIYTAQFLGADIGEIVYRIVIAVILLAFGVVKYYANYRFIVGENNDRTIMATHWLREFESLHNKKEATK